MAGKSGAVDLNGLSENYKKASELQSESVQKYSKGVFCGSIKEPVATYLEAPCETVVKGQNNSYIVLGRDRVTSMETGYGGKGHTQASMIDLVVGRMGAFPREVDEQGQDMFCHPDPSLDAARIYISQKTDIDKNFSLVAGSVGNKISRSAIALKADGIRLIGREGIKLVTRTGLLNSQGGNIGIVKGIDLIAGNDDSDLQPMPKGESLTKALQAMYDEINVLNGIVANLTMTIMKFYKDLSMHTHTLAPIPIPPLPVVVAGTAGIVSPGGFTLPSNTLLSPPVATGTCMAIKDLAQKCFMGCADQKANLVIKSFDYLKPTGGKYINSRFNKVN
tara:strand:+ start:1970 stop:2971 length:1002 start_codon:yes stop_codon:yes gene_type:complete